MYFIVQLSNYERTYDQINLFKKIRIGLYHKLVLFLQSINIFHYIPDNEIEQDILGWNTSITGMLCPYMSWATHKLYWFI